MSKSLASTAMLWLTLLLSGCKRPNRPSQRTVDELIDQYAQRWSFLQRELDC